MDPAPLIDWEYMFSAKNNANFSILGKRKSEKYLTLGDTIDIANDLELHANYLLEEATLNSKTVFPVNASSSTAPLPTQQLDSAAPMPPHPNSNATSSNRMQTVARVNFATNNQNTAQCNRGKNMDPRPPSHANTKSVRIPIEDDDISHIIPLSRKESAVIKKEREANKEPYSFSTARDTFVEEGGTFKHRKDDYKAANYSTISSSRRSPESTLPAELASYDKALVEKIESEIIHHGQPVRFDDISGLEFAKQCVVESVCWPISNPHLFQGLRAIPRGILLFGPPGTGKTLIGKAIANQSGATFFSISASSLMSKWIGEGEKTVKTLFAVAAYRQPAVVFIDEIDSLLCQRSSDENEATRRIKTEFLVQLDGAGTDLNARVVIVGATNRPEELDEAVRRRFVKRLYIPLPDEGSRRQLFDNLIRKVTHQLTADNFEELVRRTKGYSGADIQSLCTDAAMGPLRDLARNVRGQMESITPSEVPPITFAHFESALNTVQPSVSPGDLKRYLDWNTLFGSYRLTEEST